jgi:hypothetical protein
MFWNLFVRPKHRLSDKIDVCVTAFEAEDESFVRNLFYKRYIGLDIITTSSHPTRELAYKQIYDMGTLIGSHFEFSDVTMMCRKCHINPVGSMGDEKLCMFCYAEEQYERGNKNR